MRAGLALVLLLATGDARAQPAPDPQTVDLAHATELYTAATTAMTEGRYLDAAHGFAAAYDITRDPVLFYKIAAANEKAGRCEVALIYYGRYLREAKPEASFAELTRQRIVACGGNADAAPPADAPQTDSAGAQQADAGSAVTPDAGPTPPQPAPVDLGHRHDAAWLMVGGALAFVTLGTVLAYSASSSEQDITDLYVGVTGTAPTYDATTAKRYQDLIDEGHHYEYLSWAAFGVAAGFAATATILFVRDARAEQRVSVTPLVTPHESGVAATFRF